MSNKKILVADDDAGIVDVMEIALELEGYEVISTMNANNIIELCEQKPALIFLDIWMSGVNGNFVCKKIKEHDEFKNIKVVMFSANRDVKQISMDCGADDFLAKPFEITELLRLAGKYTE